MLLSDDPRRFAAAGVHLIVQRDSGMTDVDIATQSPATMSPALERMLRSEILMRMPVAGYICDVGGRIMQYNRRAAELWGREPAPGQTHAQFAAQNQFFNANGSRLARSRVEEVLQTRRSVRDLEMTVVRANGDVLVSLINAVPLLDDDGRMFGVMVCMQDITERKRAADALAHNQQYLHMQQQRWTATYENAAIGIAETDAEGRLLRINEAICNFVGISREKLMTSRLFENDQAEDRERDMAEYQRQVRGEIDFYSTEKRVVRGDGRMMWVSVRSSTVRADDGKFLYAVRVMQDITERKEAENRQKLLIDELNHRVKNTLATVQSLALQTARSTSSPQAFQQAFDGRLIALSQAHDQLTRRSWSSADLGEMVGAVMAPLVAQARDKLTIVGEAVTLNPRAALTLALAVHELTTNAVKYGALAAPEGRVNVDWHVDRDAAQPVLHLDWRERDGPPVAVPKQRGFGSRFIEGAVAAELRGRAELRFDREGLNCAIEIPLDPKLFKVGM